jgi:hypothetical protein
MAKKEKEPKRFIKIKVVNRTRLSDEKDKTILTCEADGKQIAIQDGAEVVVSEYVYNNLKDSIEPIYQHVKKDQLKDMTESPAVLTVIKMHNNYDITELSDWMDERKPEDAPVSASTVKKMLKEKTESAVAQ